MESGQISQELNEIFRDVFADDDIVTRPDMTAADIEDWDSVSHINLLIAIETRFGVKFTSSEIEKLTNVGDIENIIAARRVA